MNSKYVLITPARNEALHIDRLIQSVISQTRLPARWIIVSDGSTDATDRIVNKYRESHDFIRLVRRDSDNNRNFGSKVKAIEAGIKCLGDVDYGFIGNLDADASFDPTYYETILNCFADNSRLGIAAGTTVDVIDGVARKTLSSDDSVGGIAQFFRRECWAQVGGYRPLTFGGEDSLAEIMARMHGWEVRRIPALRVFHHREMGTGMWGQWGRRFFQGRHFHSLGYHPVFFLFKCIYRIREKPYGLGSILLFSGFFKAVLTGQKYEVPAEVVFYFRKEQLNKMRRLIGTDRAEKVGCNA